VNLDFFAKSVINLKKLNMVGAEIKMDGYVLFVQKNKFLSQPRIAEGEDEQRKMK
jgi:hypothetical protein